MRNTSLSHFFSSSFKKLESWATRKNIANVSRWPSFKLVVLYIGTRTHLSLNKDAPMSRAAETAGRITCRPILGGLHHHYGRI
jgi:hypothetical protein